MAIRHSNPNVELGINKLLEMGVLSEQGLETLGKMISSLQTLGGAPPVGNAGGRATTRRGRRGRFTISKDALAKAYASSNAKAIAEKHGVSAATVNNRLREFGISKPGRAGGKKRSRKKTKKTAKASKKVGTAKTSSKKSKKKASSKKR